MELTIFKKWPDINPYQLPQNCVLSSVMVPKVPCQMVIRNGR